jgi:hypothetical protein
VHRENKPTIEELPLHFIALVLAVPGMQCCLVIEPLQTISKRQMAAEYRFLNGPALSGGTNPAIYAYRQLSNILGTNAWGTSLSTMGRRGRY